MIARGGGLREVGALIVGGAGAFGAADDLADTLAHRLPYVQHYVQMVGHDSHL
ncbi:MAG: hypothetical protein KBT34_02035 [Prevotella sp.]|nr:hypothetical protein [Candidatus Prevotella equi]